MNIRDEYHFDRSEGQQVVIPVAVAPAVPTGVLTLLQDVHLSAEVHLFPTHPTKEEKRRTERMEEVLKYRTVGKSLICITERLTGHTPRGGNALYPCPFHTRSCTRWRSRSCGPGSSPDQTRTSEREEREEANRSFLLVMQL